SRSAICASRALRSVTSCTDAMVVRRLWISDAKSTATAGHPTAEGRGAPGRRLTVGSGPGRPPALPAQSGTQIPPLPRVARDEGVDPPGLRVAIDEERLHEQGEGDREEGAEGTEDVGPEHQREEGRRGVDPHRVTGELRLEDRLDDEVRDAVDDDDPHHRRHPAREQGDEGRWDEAEDEADVRDVVR